ncbi:hypothetical protein [Streptomyces sp. NPDC096339]|uniref:hypothetical protein n=1 Tax=Streptomyces sp. NPDC096339 TaxID=3366086 RepID=UPI003807BBFA
MPERVLIGIRARPGYWVDAGAASRGRCSWRRHDARRRRRGHRAVRVRHHEPRKQQGETFTLDFAPGETVKQILRDRIDLTRVATVFVGLGDAGFTTDTKQTLSVGITGVATPSVRFSDNADADLKVAQGKKDAEAAEVARNEAAALSLGNTARRRRDRREWQLRRHVRRSAGARRGRGLCAGHPPRSCAPGGAIGVPLWCRT